ncbi:MAG: CCE_0567 family metalloprotein [Campylobacterales bacterium]
MEDEKKELAKIKREATEIAGKIHDIVEDTLWSEYNELLPLSQALITKCEQFYAYKKAHNL